MVSDCGRRIGGPLRPGRFLHSEGLGADSRAVVRTLGSWYSNGPTSWSSLAALYSQPASGKQKSTRHEHAPHSEDKDPHMYDAGQSESNGKGTLSVACTDLIFNDMHNEPNLVFSCMTIKDGAALMIREVRHGTQVAKRVWRTHSFHHLRCWTHSPIVAQRQSGDGVRSTVTEESGALAECSNEAGDAAWRSHTTTSHLKPEDAICSQGLDTCIFQKRNETCSLRWTRPLSRLSQFSTSTSSSRAKPIKQTI